MSDVSSECFLSAPTSMFGSGSEFDSQGSVDSDTDSGPPGVEGDSRDDEEQEAVVRPVWRAVARPVVRPRGQTLEERYGGTTVRPASGRTSNTARKTSAGDKRVLWQKIREDYVAQFGECSVQLTSGRIAVD